MVNSLSIIIPIYNVENYIIRCLNKLESQKLKNIQVILVNDGSTDNSGKLCKKFINQLELKNEYVYIEKQNGGLSDARNYGLKYVKSEYVCFLDSDDYVDDNTYLILYNEIHDKNLDYVDCGFYMTYEDKDVPIYNPNYNINNLAAKGFVMAWNKIYRLKIIIENHLFFPKSLYYEDIYFFYSYLNCIDNNKIGHISEPLVHYYQRPGSISKISSNKVLDIIKIYDKVIKLNSRFTDEIEYRCIKNLNGSFLKIALKINNKNERKFVIKEFSKFIRSNFPKWRKNKYFKKICLSNLVIKYVTSLFIVKG